MNSKVIRFYLKLYWVRFLVIAILSALGISLVMVVANGMKAWNEAEPYLRQSQMAMIPLQFYMQVVMSLVFGVVYTFMWYWLMFQKGAQSFTQTSKKAIAGKEINVHWNDVIGMDEAKEEAMELVKLIKDRTEVKRIGGRILRGILMLGPPGCGKTYLAKAISTEAGLPFISMSGSEFIEMFVGVGAGRVRSLFKRARMLAELKGGCIIFIDEIDAVGGARQMDKGFGGGGQREANTTVNQLLVEMDGLKDKDANIVVIGATNAPENFLDRALLRPGRFDRKIYVDKPNLEDRERLLAYYLKEVQFDPESIKLDRLARMTVDSSPADIANLIREAALIAIRNKKEVVGMREIDEARERIALGIKRRIRLRDEEKWQTAYHEAGHAIVTYLMVPTKDVFKITITPRGYTGGVTWTPEREEIFIHDQTKLIGRIMTCLGSFAAEKLKYGFTTAGVDSDFAIALSTAHRMVWRWGMGKSGYIGNFHAVDSLSWTEVAISDAMKAKLDEDTQEILQKCMRDVQELLKKEEPLLDRLAKELVAKEELNYDEIEAIFKEFGKARPV